MSRQREPKTLEEQRTDAITALLKETGFPMSIRPGQDGALTARARDVHIRLSRNTQNTQGGVGVVAHAAPSRPGERRISDEARDEHGTLQRAFVIGDNEIMPSDTAIRHELVRNLSANPVYRFCRLSGIDGTALVHIEKLWSDSGLTGGGGLKMEYVQGSRDNDASMIRVIDALKALGRYQARVTKKQWAYVTALCLEQMHPPEIAKRYGLDASGIRHTLRAAAKRLMSGPK